MHKDNCFPKWINIINARIQFIIHDSHRKFAEVKLKDAYQYGIAKLQPLYEKGEAEAILKLLMENIIKTDQPHPYSLLEKYLTTEQQSRFHEMVQQLETYMPVQYVLQEAWFCGLKFYVDSHVLIPRPETEELVEWIISNHKKNHDLKILDIGSGSGCIPVTLKKRMPTAEIWACDISEKALEVANKNAENQETPIIFFHLDFLKNSLWENLPVFDILVSNPPYVTESDSIQMRPNVLDFEPPDALFVPDDDPLLFYRAIADFGKEHLSASGIIYTEINEKLGGATEKLFQSKGYSTELKKDMQQKDRMLKSGLV